MFRDIGVVGQGCVGVALREGMRRVFEVVTYDLKNPDDLLVYDENDLTYYPANNRIGQLVSETEGPIFICVPTPMGPNCACDTSIVESVIKDISECTDKQRIIAIKSTIPPGTTDYLNETYKSLIICFNPEFLTQSNAVEDFKNQDRIVLGGPTEGLNVLKQVYLKAFPNVPIVKTSARIAEMVKYLTNCFLATKVSFANEIKQICDKLNINYDRMIEIATKDNRLGKSHWNVPGECGMLGWGKKCFPKDLNALIYKAKELGVDPKVMIAVWEKNLEVRSERDWEN